MAKLDSEIGNSLLTIVVPVHNMSGRLTNLSKWLDETDSKSVKVILVHDQSQDTTGAELLALLEKKNSQNISLFETNVQSPGMARNRGLEAVGTPWFSFADSDDLVCVSSVVDLIAETEAKNSDIGIGSYVSINMNSGEERVISPPPSEEDLLLIHLANGMGLWRFVLSTSCFGDLRFTSHKMGEDYLYSSLVLNRSTRIFTSHKIVYKYFHGGVGNLTSNQSVMSEMFGVIDSIKKIKPMTRNVTTFKVFAIQKLTLSVLKNLEPKEKIFEKVLLSLNLLLHPFYLFKLILSIKRRKYGLLSE